MDAKEKPEGMSAEEWAEYQDMAPALRDVLLSMRKNVLNAAPSVVPPEPRRTAQIIQLPLWPEPQRASPNAFLRSAVFPAIQGKTRRYMKGELIFSQAGYEIRFTGQMLDQSDFDVWLQAAHLARCSPLGDVCQFTARGFLRNIARTGGGNDLEWLKTSLARLQTSMVEIKFGKKWERVNLLVRTSGDDETTAIRLRFDPLLIKLFASDNWTALQWEERRRLKGKPLALWLHGYYSSHAAPYPLKVDTLREMCGSETKERFHFVAALKRAFNALEKEAGIKGTLDGDLVTVTRLPSPSQGRHLLKKKGIARRSNWIKKVEARTPKQGNEEV